MALIVTSLLHCGGVSRVRGRLSQCLGLGLIGIVGDGRRLLVEIDLDVTHAGHLLQRLLDRDRTESARHVLHVERDGFRGAASATKGKAKSTAISSLRMVNLLQ
ncbi:hypothetical protein AI3058V1_1848 [Citrobacter freundii]|nr:hypothetical protein AI3058V1_1848 [Citrobacter freundii]